MKSAASLVPAKVNADQLIWKLRSGRDRTHAVSMVHDLCTGKLRFNDCDQLVKLCMTLAESAPKALAININKITTDPFVQFGVVKECVRNLGYGAGEIIRNFKNTAIKSANHQALIAIEAARRGDFEDIIKVATESGISFDNHRLALAKACASSPAHGNFCKSDHFKKLSNQEKFELYKYALSLPGGWQYRQNLSYYPQFNPKQLKALLSSIAKNRPEDLGYHIDYLKPGSEAESLNFLNKLIKADPQSAAVYYPGFKLSSEEHVIKALTQIALNAPAEFAENLSRYKLTDSLTESVICSVVSQAVKEKKFQQLSLFLDKTFNEIHKEDSEQAWGRAVDFLRLQKCIPESSKLLDSRVDTFSQRYQALAAICLAADDLPSSDPDMPLSRTAIKILSGFPEKIFNCSENSQSLGELYLNVFNELSYPQQKRIMDLQDPAPELKQVNSLLSLSRAYGCLKTALGTKPKQFKVSQQNADRLIEEFQKECRQLLSELFQVQISEKVDLAKNAENIVAVAILASRYQEKKDWNSAMPVLKEIIEHMVNGTFSQFKYADKQQLFFLNQQQKQAWQETVVSMKVLSPEQISEADIILKVSEVLRNNLLPHTGASIHKHKKIELDESTLQDDRKFLKTLVSIQTAEKKIEFVVQLISQYCVTNDLDRLKLLMQRIGSSHQVLFKDLNLDAKQIKKDFEDIKSALKSLNRTGKNEFLSLCLITDDPYTLFTIGTAVEAASCQSYTNGCYANTLPAYVIDGNIQAALNFVIPLARLGALANAVKRDPQSVDLRIDFVNRKVTLSHDGQDAEIALDKALSRRILRLGYIDLEEKQPVIFPEPSYYQVHGVREQGDRQLLELAEQKAQNMQAYSPEPGEEISFPATRNIEQGVYCDSSRDDPIQLSEYKLLYPHTI